MWALPSHLWVLTLDVEALGLLVGARELNVEASRLTECFLPHLWVPGAVPCTQQLPSPA